jgi:photosystem II stability/assembly factor-like uncharacterized protein
MKQNYLRISVALVAILVFATSLLVLRNLDQLDEQPTAAIVKTKKFFTPKELKNLRLQAKAEKRKNGHAKSDSPDEYMKYHHAIRVKEGETAQKYGANYKINALNKAENERKKSGSAREEALDWVERGPGNVPGRTRGLIVFPDDATHNTWLAGSVGGGIWKTTDGGTTWTPKSENFPSLAITTLALAESNPNIVYAGTGETLASLGEIIGDGIFKSEDQGETWSQLVSTAESARFKGVSRLIVSPTDPDVILAATAGYFWNSDLDSYLMKSIDGGESWTEVYATSESIDQIVSTPGNFDVQYASVNSIGVLKSVDAGDTWTNASIGLVPDGRMELAVSSVNTNRLFASAQGNVAGTGSDLYISDDAAASWSIVLEANDGAEIDFLGTQGWYDNTIATDPYNEDIVYYGGVNLFRTTMQSGLVDDEIINITVEEEGTEGFLDHVSFTEAEFGPIGLAADILNSAIRSVEIRFGAGSQKAHRFTVPSGSGPGVAVADYSYQDYVEVPFQVWDIDNDIQLMVSFRDQQDDGVFNLIARNTDAGDELNHSREYIFVHTEAYGETASAAVSVSGGHEVNHMYQTWPFLAEGGTWDAANLPISIYRINAEITPVTSRIGITKNVSDAYNQYDEINNVFGNDDPYPFHPDQHNLLMIPIDEAAKTYQILVANDGGVFASNISTEPGIEDGDWGIRGLGYNTTQFYGADKKPGANVYGAGAQDNGTWMSVANEDASKTSEYTEAFGGDGFEVLWNSADGDKFIGGSQNNGFGRTLDGGLTFTTATNGLSGTSPFISKLASSNNNPDVIFSVTSAGVFRSEDFGGNWELTPIAEGWGSGSFLNVEVSVADYNTVWAGIGMGSTVNFHVSTDNGLTFEKTNNYTETTLGSSSGIATHPSEAATAYALFSFANSPKVLRTTDLGQTWEDISGFGVNATSDNGFPDVAVYSLLVMPHDTNVLWAGTEIGIFESLDNGATWAYADSGLPAVSVWQMKVVDDQIVVATHGRGIWSVTIPELPEITITPIINALGTSPKGGLSMDISLRSAYDSTDVFVNGNLAFQLKETSVQDLVFNVQNVAANDSLGVIVTSYSDNGKGYSSNVKSIEVFEVNAAQKLYSNDFDAGSTDFNVLDNKFVISKFSGFDNIAIHSKHDYEEGTTFPGGEIEYIAQLRTPIIINAENATFQYQDVAIVEPGESGTSFGDEQYWDYVIVEGTKDGFTWTPILDGYDASLSPSWLTAYNTASKGDKSMFFSHEIDLLETFNAQDTVMFRFRLHSDPLTAGYGWVIDNLYIQDIQTAIPDTRIADEGYSIYPNPVANDIANIAFNSSREGVLETILMDVRGVVQKQYKFSITPGMNELEINTKSLSPGTYFVRMNNAGVIKTERIIIQ